MGVVAVDHEEWVDERDSLTADCGERNFERPCRMRDCRASGNQLHAGIADKKCFSRQPARENHERQRQRHPRGSRRPHAESGAMLLCRPVNCSSCGSEMERLALNGHGGASLEIDLCRPCRAFWFDAQESLQLAPGSTLRLFSLIGDETTGARTMLSTALRCPRCRARLILT